MKLLLSIFLTGVGLLGPTATVAAGPQCRRVLLERPDIHHSIEAKLTILQETLLQLRASLKQSDPKDPMAPLMSLKKDPRELAYLLQGSYRLLIAHPLAKSVLGEKDFKLMKKGLNDLKWFEKTLGQYTTQVELLEVARKHQMPEDFVYFLMQRRDQVSQQVQGQLRDKDYLNKKISAVTELAQKINHFKMPSHFDQAQWLRTSLRHELSRVHEKVVAEMSPLIKAHSYGYREIEYGAHAFRRSLRWLKVYLNSYPEHFALKRHPHLSEAETALLLRYSHKMDLSYDQPDLIQIRDIDYAQIIHAIDSLRKVKKNGEMRELLSHELAAFGRWNERPVSREEALVLISEILKKEDGKLEKKTQEILQDYESHNGFEGMIVEGGP